MPYQIKNGIIYSGNAMTLTQAQYDALPTIQKNNGTVYYIYDSNDIVDAEDVGVNGGNVEDLAGSVATFETSQATSSHAVGEYILYQANLYKVIAPIDSGETLTVGSNIESAKVGDELSELKAGIINKTSSDIMWNQYTAQGSSPIHRVTKYMQGLHIELVATYNVNIPAGTTFAALPENYRPSTTTIIPAIIVTSEGTAIYSYVYVTTAGAIYQNDTNIARRFYIDAFI